MASANKIRIFITDDHYMVIEGMRSLLLSEKNIEWAGHAMNASSCLSFLKSNDVDVVLLDINLPDQSGIDLCKQIKKLQPSVRVIGLSSFHQQSYISRMMQEGADGYVLKNASREELIKAITAVMNGQTFLSKEATAAMSNSGETKLPVLTRREKEVLKLIAEGLTKDEIAEKLFISPATVDSHRTNLLFKFEAKNAASLVRMAMELSLI